jgi:hypothetical protein
MVQVNVPVAVRLLHLGSSKGGGGMGVPVHSQLFSPLGKPGGVVQ